MVGLDLEKYKAWLQQNGAEILPTTNEWELVRFKGKEVGVIYKSGKTSNSYSNQSVICFLKGTKWDGFPLSTSRMASYNKFKISLLKRDGNTCFYCGKELKEDISLEHLIPLSAGGKNILGNMVLAHKQCNHEQGSKTLVEKIKFILKNRKE